MAGRNGDPAERAIGGDPDLVAVAHLRVLTWRLLWAHASTVLDWVEWARRYLAGWDDTQASPERTAAATKVLTSALGPGGAAVTESGPRRTA